MTMAFCTSVNESFRIIKKPWAVAAASEDLHFGHSQITRTDVGHVSTQHETIDDHRYGRSIALNS